MVATELKETQQIEKEMEICRVITLADIYRALREHPDWALEIRKVLLSIELLELPKRFNDFVINEFKPLSNKVDKIEKDVEVLKEDVAVLKEDVAVLKEDVAVLKEDVAVLKEDVAVLKEDVALLKEDVAVLKEDVRKLKNDVGSLKGDVLELRVRYNIGAFIGKFLRKAKVIDSSDLADMVYDAVEKGIITEQEADDARLVDVVAEGYIRKGNGRKIMVAVEVSNVGDVSDIQRVARRANVVGKAYNAECVGLCISKSYTEGAKQKAEELNVVLL